MSECGLFWVSGALFWVGGGEWGVWDIILGGWGSVGVGGALFWVGRGGWENILGWWGWGGGEWG